MNKRKKGNLGEGIAGEYLVKKGYQIIERNYINKLGEIDLICTKGEWLIFVEVKMKVGEDYGSPEEMINWKKLQKIKKVAQGFLMFEEMVGGYEKYRVDAVCIVMDEKRQIKRVSHYENIGSEL